MQPRIIITGLALLVLLAANLAAAAEKSSRTLAIMSVDAGASGVVVDQLTALLSSDPQIRLIEREAIARVLREQELSAQGLTAGGRAILGQLVGAEVLVLIGRNPIAGTNAVRILVCDALTGTRMGQIQAVIAAAGLGSVAAELRSVLGRFPQGVQSVVALSDLISRDLRFEHAGLQTGLAELLRVALTREPGLALVELEEAKAIAGEHALTGGAVQRIVPLFVEGEFRTEALAAGGPKISITVTLRMVQREALKVESGQIPLNDAGKFVLGPAQASVLGFLKRPGAAGFDAGQEFARLLQRADQFAAIGDFDRAAAVREAALLLQPQANEQRIRLVRDYSAANHFLVDAWPKGAQRNSQDPFWSQVFSHRRETWRRCLYHVEYLIRNQCVDIQLGTTLFDGAIHAITGIRGTEAARLQEEESLKKKFLRQVAPLLLKLPGKNGQAASRNARSTAAYRVYDYTFMRMDGNYLAADDLILAGDLLCELLPENTPLAMKMVYVLGSGTGTFGNSSRDVTPEVWLNFVQRLINSPRPLVNAYGRYARLCDQRIRLKQHTEAMLTEAKNLAAAAQAPPLAELDVSGELHRIASDNVVWIEMALRPKKTSSPVSTPVHEKGPIVQPDGSLLCDQVRLKPIELALSRKSKSQPASGVRSGERMVKCDGFLPAWPGVDVVYSLDSVGLVRNGFQGEEVFVDEKRNIGSVVFDGQYLWISTGYDRGVYAIDRDGRTVARVGLAEGLPEAYVNMPLWPLQPGRVMASGSINQSRRGWLATIELRDGKLRVNVFHEAIKVRAADPENAKQLNLDPTVSFMPEWITEHRDQTGKRWVFVGRDHNPQPLVVDVDSLAVSVYPAGPFERECFPRNDSGLGAFRSRDGLLYVAGSNRDFRSYRFDPESRRLFKAADRSDSQWHYGTTAGCLAEYGGKLYYVGSQRWLRCAFDGGDEKVLIASPRSLPRYGSGDSWRVSVSNLAGLVAWSGGQLYQVIVEP